VRATGGYVSPDAAIAVRPPDNQTERGKKTMQETADYTISRARYAKGSIALRAPSGDGFKTRAAYLAEALKGRWSNREHAYIMAASKEAKFRRLYDEGWDATIFGELIQPKAAA
jgi:hypothetical protein